MQWTEIAIWDGVRKLEVHKNNINHEHVYITHGVPGTPLMLLYLLTYLNAIIILILLIRKQMYWRCSTLSNLAQLVSGRPKHWSFSFNINPSNEYSGLISFRMNWLDLLAVQGTLIFYSWVVFHFIYVPHLLYPFTCWRTFRLLPRLGYCKLSCYEHWDACIFLN